ncbi:SdpI family protein [Chryseolinea lacunae]|uniref:SdpI family protein n=1 Tax=Chryseolinea lacunae TaxID=2801331 RepID=A0ABS1KY91_9BACT|nr:SdpI family protein [Chryseolinea lacunae]MBL0744415.1 SdpI family protein [Chryseolinea lacunae]
MLSYIVAGLTILVIGLIIKYSKIDRNYWLGYRTPRSMKSPAHWTFANQRMALHAVIIGVLSTVAGVVFCYGKVNSIYLMIFTLSLLLISIVDVETALRRFDRDKKD